MSPVLTDRNFLCGSFTYFRFYAASTSFVLSFYLLSDMFITELVLLLEPPVVVENLQ